MSRARRILRWLAIGLGGVLGLVALTLGALYGLAQTEGGRAWLKGFLERGLSTPGEFELAIGRLDGPLPHSLRVSAVQISDRDGPWLEAAAVRLDWRPLALLSRTVWIESIEARDLRIARRPSASPAEETDSPNFSLPSLPGRVVLERLAVDDVTLDAPVLGDPASFRILGEASAPTTDDLRAVLRIERSDGTAGRLEAQAHYRISHRNLKLTVSADEPERGIIARALELPDLPAVAVRFDGDGPISAWDGRLALQLTGLGSAEVDVALSGEEDLAFTLTGSVETSRPLQDPPWMLLAGRTSLDVSGRWSEPGLLAIDRARLENAAVMLSLSGTLDLHSLEADAQAEGGLADGRLLAALIDGAESDRLALRASLRGTLERGDVSLEASTARLRVPGAEVGEATVKVLARRPLLEPELRVEIEAGSLSAPLIVAEALSARARFHPERPLDTGEMVGPLEIDGGVRRLSVEGAPILQSLVGEEGLGWELTGRVDLGRDALTADHLKLGSENLTLTASGELDLAGGAAEAKVDVILADLTDLDPHIGLGLSGRGEASVAVQARNFGESLEARLSGVLRALAAEDPVARALLTDQVTLAADIALEPEGRLAIKDLALESRQVRVAGAATLSKAFEELEADYQLVIDDLAPLGAALEQDLSGGAQAEGRAFGPIANPQISGSLMLDKAAVEGFGLAGLRFDYVAEDPAGTPRGQATGRAATPVGDLDAQVDFRLDGQVLHLSKMNLKAGASQASGRAAIPLDGGPATGQVEARSPDLAPWLALAGIPGAGSGTAELTLSADKGRQAGALSAKLSDLSIHLEDGRSLRAGDLSASLESRDLLGEIEGTVSLAAKDVAAGDLSLETLSVDGSGGLAAADYRFAMAGQWSGPLTLQADGHIAYSEPQIAVDVARLEGKLLGQPLRSKQGFRIVQAPGLLELTNTDLTYGGGRVTASARLGPDTLAADLTVAELSLALIEPLWPGKGMTGMITADLDVAGPATRPTGRLTASVTDLKADAVSQAPPGQLALSGDWRNERVAFEGAIKGLAEQDVVFSLALPLRLDPETLTPSVSMQDAIAGRVAWQGNLAELWPLVPITGHDFRGLCEADLTLGGSLGAPRLNGGLTLSDGTYENLATGTLLRDLDLAVRLEGQRVMLAKLGAKDGASGSLTARGELDLAPDRDFSMGLSASLKDFVLVRLDDVTAAAKGDLSLTGSFQAARLQGSLETSGVEIRIPNRLPPQVVELEVVEAGKETGQPRVTGGPTGEVSAFRLSLDLGVAMPRQVFLRGRGLDSEWAGELHASGTAEQPILKGKLELVRGQISVVGRTFKLEGGSVEFLGGDKIDPLIDIKAVSETNRYTVTVRVSGSASNPEIALSSIPDLPQDEIVSRLLFGKSTTELSGLEAIQLAAAVAELSGGGTTNVLDLARGGLGIDVLRVESTDEEGAGGTAVSAGKYVTEDVYVGGTQATAADSGSVEVEVELTPNIFLESKVGQTGQSNLGIKFKWDY